MEISLGLLTSKPIYPCYQVYLRTISRPAISEEIAIFIYDAILSFKITRCINERYAVTYLVTDGANIVMFYAVILRRLIRFFFLFKNT